MSADAIRQGLRDIASGVSAGGYTLADARAVLGYNIKAPSEEFLLDLQTDGPFMLVMPAVSGDYDPKEFYAHYDITVYVWFGFDRDANQDFKGIEQWLDAIRVQWNNFTALAGVAIDPPTKGPKWEHTINPNIKPAVVLYTMNLRIGEGNN